MSGPAIIVDGLTKRYVAREYRPTDFKEYVLRSLKRVRDSYTVIWPLRGVSFSVERGESLGIIGPNGSGKTTLLRCVAGVIQPTEGRIDADGLVVALLGLGAGFNPEQTGRENVYLHASLHGLPRSHVDDIIDDVVEFAGLENAINMPLKTYSSGMYARLAFAIAVQVEPDILILDEVLSVGDASFRKKSMDRMRRFRDEGKTILFVSHQLSAVRSYCDRVLWLDNGEVQMLGVPDDVIDKYQNHYGGGKK